MFCGNTSAVQGPKRRKLNLWKTLQHVLRLSDQIFVRSTLSKNARFNKALQHLENDRAVLDISKYRNEKNPVFEKLYFIGEEDKICVELFPRVDSLPVGIAVALQGSAPLAVAVSLGTEFLAVTHWWTHRKIKDRQSSG